MSKTKRGSAFDEFSGKSENSFKITPVGEVGGELDFERVELIKVTDLLPDPDQPRAPLLPSGPEEENVRERFLSGEIDCFQAVKEWIRFAKKDKGHTRQIQFLRDMAAGFESPEGGQINPITAVWTEAMGVAMIETGEQRFWSAVIGYVDNKMAGPVPELRAVIRPFLSKTRQVLENRHIGPPTVVTQAREIASLFISEGLLKVPEELLSIPSHDRDSYDIHRWVLRSRKPHKSWEDLEQLMSMSARRMRMVLGLLALPTYLLNLANRNSISSRALEDIVYRYKAEDWEEMVYYAIEQGWPPPDEELGSSTKEEQKKKKKKSSKEIAYTGVKKFFRVIKGSRSNPAATIGFVADEVAGSKDALEAYNILAHLTNQIELRLIDRGLINKEIDGK